MGKKAKEIKLYKAESASFRHWPKFLRWIVGWATIIIFAASFLVTPISLCALPLLFYYGYHKVATGWLAVLVTSLLTPQREWEAMRVVGELWYEIFDFSCNLSPEDRDRLIRAGWEGKYAITMHPHGVIPFHAYLWASYCHQYFSDEEGRYLYGFAAGADAIEYMPILRQIMGWLTTGSASYSALKKGIEEGISPPANRNGRFPQNLFILPGGVAEIFESRPNENTIVFKNRFGLARLSVETGCQLIPTYVFGATDFFCNPISADSFVARLSRKLKMGLCIFYGPLLLPIVPFAPKITLVIGEPLKVKKWEGEGRPPREQVAELQGRYLAAVEELFDKYKGECGYPDGRLNIH